MLIMFPVSSSSMVVKPSLNSISALRIEKLPNTSVPGAIEVCAVTPKVNSVVSISTPSSRSKLVAANPTVSAIAGATLNEPEAPNPSPSKSPAEVSVSTVIEAYVPWM